MSSHHIVREKQEPALLILGLDNFSDELLGQLLEWSPTVITTPVTAEKIDAAGIKIDMVLAEQHDYSLQSDVRLIMPGNHSAVEAALAFLLSAGYPAANVVTDDFQIAEFLPYASEINLVIFCKDQKIFPVTSGFSKWKPAGEPVRIYSAPAALETVGLLQVGDAEYITTHDGFISLKFDQPFIFVAEKI